MARQLFITELLKQLKIKYVELIDDSVEFFKEYDALYGVYAKETDRVVEIKKQLDTIISYKQEHGYYPQIKDQPDAESYIEELHQMREKAERELKTVEPEVFRGFEKRRKLLDALSKSIANCLIREKDASKFITSMVLRAPLENDHTRCPNNEKNKPIYIAALSICLLQRLLDKELVEHPFIAARIPTMVPCEETPDTMVPHPKMLEEFRHSVIIPIIQGVLIHNIGSYSFDADRIYSGNRYRLLEETERKKLIKIIHKHTINYLRYGIGKPREAEFSANQADEYELQVQRFELTEEVVSNYTKASHPLGNLLRIPMIYASFILSTKPKHDFNIMFRAFDIMRSGIEKEVIYKPYAQEFLRLVGRYPLGSGIFFNSKETHLPERAVVTGINPPSVNSAIVKQLTRRQVQFDDHTQVVVSKEFNLANEEARKSSDFGPEYYKKQFPNGYFWNPAEPWERDIDHVKFWRRDNKLKEN